MKSYRPSGAAGSRFDRKNRVQGVLDVHRDGFGFVRAETGLSGDIFIPPGELNGAMQGDQVLVELAPRRPDGRLSGRIVRVLGRFNNTVVGVFHYARDKRAPGHTVVPSDERLVRPVLIRFGMERGATWSSYSRDRVVQEEAASQPPVPRLRARPGADGNLEGMVVEVEITGWPTEVRGPEGRVIEILGAEDDFGVDVEIMIRKHHLPHRFPEKVIEEAAAAAELEISERAGAAARENFRGLPVVTIDGETARDFDDAVLVRKEASGWELQVHIADVAEYVAPGSALDQEARLRGTSVYFPDRAVPMLPQELSSGVCSLRPNEDRLVLSCIMRMDELGAIRDFRVTEGVIRSVRRMTYTQVHAILEGDQAARHEFAPLVEGFEQMYELARLLHQKRQRRGSIDFDLPEPVIEFDDAGQMQSIVRSERSWANRLIEEFMLAANECVAAWLSQAGIPALYRIHEKPEARRVVEFEQVAATFGYSLGIGALPVRRVTMKADRRESRRYGGHSPREYEIPEDIPVTPQMYQRLALKIAGKPEERILSHLMLRSLRQARYSEKNEGHFALAADCYTHFTSPIRRYPDLITHRIVKWLLRSGLAGDSLAVEDGASGRSRRHGAPALYDKTSLQAIAEESSYTERRADEAERELIEWKKLKFMRDKVGDEFDAMVMSTTRYGCFVELDSLFVEGLVPITSLEGDFFRYHEPTRQIIGERFGKRYSLGDKVRVILDRVDNAERRLSFSIVETGSARSSSKPPKLKPVQGRRRHKQKTTAKDRKRPHQRHSRRPRRGK